MDKILKELEDRIEELEEEVKDLELKLSNSESLNADFIEALKKIKSLSSIV